MHTICIIVSFITVEAKWVAQVFIFFRDYPHIPECLWYNEFVYVSSLNLTVLVTDGYKYKDSEQV